MQDIISQIADKLGIDEDKAGDIFSHLSEGGHDVQNLLQQGNISENIKGLVGDKFGDILHNVPGIGDMFGNMLGEKSVDNQS